MTTFDRRCFDARPRWLARLGRLALSGLLAVAALAQAAPRLTIVDGEASVLDGDRALLATEGQTLGAEAIVRTGGRTTLLRIEWPDGTAADLGPDTEAMVEPGGFGLRGGRAPALYLMRGWVKLSALGSATTPGLLTPRVDVPPFKGVLVLMAGAGEQWLFAESGAASLLERDAKAPAPLALRTGEVYAREGGAKGTVAPRPTPAQMQRVPRGFRDSLPLRLAAVKDRSVNPRSTAMPGYADLHDWLAGERALRRHFTKRFAAQAREPAFRAALAEHLGSHPEWEPVLFPERFTKPASGAR
ncbi:MAG: hypothetical protein U1F56_01205 [Rubrivivax sp.]